MNKNVKRIFFVLTLVMLLATVGAVSAADDTNSTATVDSSVSDTATVSDTVTADPATTTSNDNKVDTKTIEKNDKNLKKETTTVNVNDYTSLYNAIRDASSEELVINLEEGTYNVPWETWSFTNENLNKIRINGNNKTLTGSTLTLQISFELEINNITMNNNLLISNAKDVTINSSTINSYTFTNNANTIIINTIIPNKSYSITNNANLSLINSSINRGINNQANSKLIISDDTILEQNFKLDGTGEVITNQSILQYYSTYNGEITIENVNLTSYKTNNGNLHLINVNVSSSINNKGELTIEKSYLSSTISNQGTLNISDDTTFGENFQIAGNGQVIYSNLTELIPYLQTLNGNITLENYNITKGITTYGNIQIINSNISAKISNQENITFINCSFSNNNMSVRGSKTNGFLLYNIGNATMIKCIMENNTFNTTLPTYNGQIINCAGAIINRGFLNISDSTFFNNKVGYVNVYDTLLHADVSGSGGIITNNGTLFIDNSTFTNGYSGGYGGAIDNNGNMTINNTVFENNTSQTAGSCIINRRLGNFTIENSNFTDNIVDLNHNAGWAGGGVIVQDDGSYKVTICATIYNCTFQNNIGKYTGSVSLFGVSGAGGALLLGGATYNITECKFINNDISNGKAYYTYSGNTTISNTLFESSSIVDYNGLNLINNTFTNKSGITKHISWNYANKTIINNTFINNDKKQVNAADNTIALILDESFGPTLEETIKASNITIANNTYTNTSINDRLVMNIPNKIYAGEPITITGTYQLNEPYSYDENILEQNKFLIYINGELNQTVDTLDFNVTPTAGSMMLTVQPTISQTRKTTVIRSTTLSNIIITPENYNEYIYESMLIGVGKDSKVAFNGTFTDKDEILIDTNDIIIDGTNATFTNTIFILDNENITLQNMDITNTQTTYPIQNFKDNNIINHNTITLTNTQDKTAAIYNKANNTQITNNTLYVDGPAATIDFTVGGAVADTQAILLIGGNNNTIQNNTITVTTTQENSYYGTIEAITNSNGATNTLITQNTINISNANFNYAIDCLSNDENITITENTILVTGERYCDGIQVGNGVQNIIITNNNITCVCINSTPLLEEGAITYGVIATSMGSAESSNITINENNINLTGQVNYAIELYKVNNTEIHNNNITVTGPLSLGIGYSYAPNGNATRNTIIIQGDSTSPINPITEEIKPENTGIRVQNGTQNINIENNTITTSDIGQKDSTINTDESTVTIKNNKLISSQGYGKDTIIAPTTATIENNTILTSITFDDIQALKNTPVTLTATVIDEFKNNLTSGIVRFTDSTGNIIAEITPVNGVATTTATFTTTGESTITVTYTPTSTGISTSTSNATLTIEEPQTQLSIEKVTLTAGETVTLTATVTDQAGNNITGGKVVFKVNGKTVKDANGKVIYAKVVDGVATVEYTVPDNMNGKDLNITVTYSGSGKYNKATTGITTTVEETTPTFTTESVTGSAGTTIQLKATITDGDKVINTGKVVFKINSKTVKDENGKVIYAKVVNNQVIVNYTLPADMKAKDYNITATFISSDYERLEDTKTLTVN